MKMLLRISFALVVLFGTHRLLETNGLASWIISFAAGLIASMVMSFLRSKK